MATVAMGTVVLEKLVLCALACWVKKVGGNSINSLKGATLKLGTLNEHEGYKWGGGQPRRWKKMNMKFVL